MTRDCVRPGWPSGPAREKALHQHPIQISISTLGRRPLLSFAWFGRGKPEKICGFDPKSPSEPVHHVDAGGVKVSFKRADIGTVDFGTVRQLFLRKAACPSKLPQIEREYLSYLHA